jgi:hypothetical protein
MREQGDEISWDLPKKKKKEKQKAFLQQPSQFLDESIGWRSTASEKMHSQRTRHTPHLGVEKDLGAEEALIADIDGVRLLGDRVGVAVLRRGETWADATRQRSEQQEQTKRGNGPDTQSSKKNRLA